LCGHSGLKEAKTNHLFERRTNVAPPEVNTFSGIKLDPINTGIAWLSSRLACIILDHISHFSVLSMMSMIRISLVGDIDSNTVANRTGHAAYQEHYHQDSLYHLKYRTPSQRIESK